MEGGTIRSSIFNHLDLPPHRVRNMQGKNKQSQGLSQSFESIIFESKKYIKRFPFPDPMNE